MEPSNQDLREILRIIDECQLDELRIEVAGFSLNIRRDGAPAVAPPASASPQPAAAPSPGAPPAAEAETVTAPMLGIFYRSQSPGEPPFVEVGSVIKPDSVVGLIEVMKLMNSVPAGLGGTVAEIYAENGAMVEYGQPLVRVVPK